MTKEDIIRKLTSRKFWMAIVALVSGLLMAFKVDAKTAEIVSGTIMSVASVIAYILGEGLVDAENKADALYIAHEVTDGSSDKPPDDEEEEDF